MTTLPRPLAALGLRTLPFPKAPPPAALYRWPTLDEVLARLRFALDLQGCALLTGEVGAGKSTALRLFLHSLDPNRHPAVYVAESRLTPRGFYARVLEQFGVPPAALASPARRQFQSLLGDLSAAQDKHPLIVIDEAHELPAEMVQELRYLQNIGEFDAQSPFTLVLCGQPELRATLRLKAFDAVAQRLSVRAHLGPLPAEHTAAFLTHGLRQAGVDRPLFTEAAVTLLHAHTNGLCRRIGLLATHALLDAALAQSALVEEPSVRRAIAEIDEP